MRTVWCKYGRKRFWIVIATKEKCAEKLKKNQKDEIIREKKQQNN